MVLETEFVDQVRDAYAHLYDLVYLRKHALVELLAPGPALSGNEKAWQLHHILLDVIGELEPGPQVPVFSRQWRRHQLMLLRYVKALEPQAVMDQLNISRRHYYREHSIALQAIAALLWGRRAPSPAPSQAVEEQSSLGRLELLRLEAARMAQASRFARVDAVLEGVLPLLQKMLQERGIAVEQSVPESLPSVSIDQTLLRQLFLGIIGYLVDCSERATLRLEAAPQDTSVCITVSVEPPEAVRPQSRAEADERFSAFQEMAGLGAAQVQALRAGQVITGVDVRLPVARRTVLVVDDNEDVLELFRRYLGANQYQVVTARTAQEALTLARRLRPYAISLDLMMPEQDGWDLLQLLLNQPETCQIPIIVCTVLKQKKLALSLGASGFLEKPVSEQALLAALSALELK